MDQQDRDEDKQRTKTRLPYEPPAVISEEVFETLALSCGKADPVNCQGGNPDRS